jgi:hypothetical protein
MRTCILFDIDGVCSYTNEKELTKQYSEDIAKNDYSWFLKYIEHFKPSQFSILMINMFAEFHKIIFITARNEGTREKTIKWIEKYYTFKKYHPYKLLCRGLYDFSDDVTLKRKLYEKYIKGKYKVLFAFEDKYRICNLYKSLGITSLQVRLKDRIEL